MNETRNEVKNTVRKAVKNTVKNSAKNAIIKEKTQSVPVTLVVGAGFSGAAAARKIAEEMNEKVLLIDRRNHVAGNCFDRLDPEFGYMQEYGAHLFHTQNEEVWKFLSRFTNWNLYMHRVVGVVEGKIVPIPFNLNSIEALFPKILAEKLTQKLLERFSYGKRIPILELRKSEDSDLIFLADYVYENVFLHYTQKQWGLRPDELSKSVTERVPVVISRDDRYFSDRFQGLPIDETGTVNFTHLVRRMLDHPNIETVLETDFADVKGGKTAKNLKKTELSAFRRIIYTGAVDEYFDFKFGELPYRSLRWKFQTCEQPFALPNVVVNYPNNFDFTRALEFEQIRAWNFQPPKGSKTRIAYEYSQPFERGKNERYYPIPGTESAALYERYASLAATVPNLFFLGRLGLYRYINIDQTVEQALQLFDRLKIS